MIKIKAELVDYQRNVLETKLMLMPVTISIMDDIIIVKAKNGATVSMGISEEGLTLLAWANDDGAHDPNLILPVEVVPNMEFNPAML